jgi:peptide/nickel transport system permease protein
MTALPALRSRVRRGALLRAGLALGLVLAVLGLGALLPAEGPAVSAATRNLPPSLAHPLGTDLLGRDMAERTLLALALSVKIGLLAALLSAAIALALGLAAASDPRLDRAVGVATEMALGLPHFVLLMLIAYATGGGAGAVILGVGLTHWPRLARILRVEAQSVAASDYVAVSRALGRGPLWRVRHHLAPHLLPQLGVGFVLIFPHAILHEAGLSFVGLGVEPHLPSIGVILSESLRGLLAGSWWLAVLPGAALLLVAASVEVAGESLRRAADPAEGVA